MLVSLPAWDDALGGGVTVPGVLMSQAWTGLRAGEGLRAKVAGSPPGRALEDETGVPGGRCHGKQRPVSG